MPRIRWLSQLSWIAWFPLALSLGCGGSPSNPAPAPVPSAYAISSPLPAAAQAATAYASHASTLGSGMSGPNGLALDSAGNLYESDYYRGTVTRVTPSGQGSTYASGFAGPAGLAFDRGGNLFVACYESHTLERIPPGGGSKAVYASAGLKNPVWPAIGSRGTLYLADYSNGRIATVGPNSVQTFASIPGVNAIAIDPQDNLWITTWGGTVTRVSPTGQQTSIASGLGTACAIAWSPSYLAVATYGGESGRNGRLVLMDFSGGIHPVGDGLDRPSSVIFDPQGNLYSANIGDTSLRKYSLR